MWWRLCVTVPSNITLKFTLLQVKQYHADTAAHDVDAKKPSFVTRGTRKMLMTFTISSSAMHAKFDEPAAARMSPGRRGTRTPCWSCVVMGITAGTWWNVCQSKEEMTLTSFTTVSRRKNGSLRSVEGRTSPMTVLWRSIDHWRLHISVIPYSQSWHGTLDIDNEKLEIIVRTCNPKSHAIRHMPKPDMHA